MGKILSEALALYRQANFLSALGVVTKIGRVSKDYAVGQKLKADCHYNIGAAHVLRSGLIDEAELSFRECLRIDPQHENANNNLAAVLVIRNKLEQAIPYYQKTLRINPNRLKAVFDLAICHERLDQHEQASELFRKASQLDPADGSAQMRDALLVKGIIPDKPYISAVRQRIDSALDRFIESGRPIAHPERANGSYFFLSYHGLCNRSINKKIAQAYLRAAPSLTWTAPHVPQWSRAPGRIKIAFISEHFFNHSIGQTSRGMIAELDRSRFEVVVVHLGSPRKDAVHQWINEHADAVVSVGTDSLQSAREGIAKMRLDIAFWQDIGMAPFSYFLAYARLAPVQLTSFGHPDTTGIPNIDYFLSSDCYENASAQSDYSERLVTLPGAGTLAYYFRPDPAGPQQREYFGLSRQDHVYICPQTLFKIHPDMDELFRKICQRDEHARIILIEPAEAGMKAGIVARFGNSLPQYLEKLTFIPRISEPSIYMALLGCSDVMLDTVHFNGQNTNLEAFSLGLPVVTLPGALQRGRHTTGMYRAMGFGDLVARSPDHYAELACAVATNHRFAGRCRSEISTRSQVLYENTAFVRNLETALLDMVAQAPCS